MCGFTVKPLNVVLLLMAGAVTVVAVAYARRGLSPAGRPQEGPDARQEAASQRYVDPAVCAQCHGDIARTYSLTGMARSFSRLRSESTVADFTIRNRLYHEASRRHYTMVERAGRFYQQRHEVGFDGRRVNRAEFQVDYIIGSGNHARTFLHRTPDGRLVQMPVSWYADRGGYWAMSPGYDRPAHLDFRRVINQDCMACHNGYPREAVTDDGPGPKFAEPLPEGIDCQRCHGPGQAHVEAIKAGKLDAARRAIVNPAQLDRDRQVETCMQCHLETTSSPLPFRIRRYEHPPFSFVPGSALGDHFIHFDHAAGSGREDKFEIAGGAYRLRKSVCFQRSQMTCLTCHNPHDIPRGEKAVRHYRAVCLSCHEGAHSSGVSETPRVGAGARAPASCIDCHMPKRRAEDAVHVVVTDHFIQRRRPPGDLLAPRKEAENFEHGAYRREVVPYYPAALPATPENDLYLALAQVQQGSNLAAGIPRLRGMIEKHRPARPDFYYELARAYSKIANHEAAIRWCGQALRRDPSFAPALKELGAAATRAGRLPQAAQALERAVALRPRDADALGDLGNVYLQQDRLKEALRALRQALSLDSNMPLANNTTGLTALKRGEMDAAEGYFRAAIRSQPDLAEARNNLGNLLASRKAYAEAGYHFEQAIRSDPSYVEAHHGYGLVLAMMHSYREAVRELQAAIRLAGSAGGQARWGALAQARVDLADVLAAMGRFDEAAREYERAIDVDPDEHEAHLALGQLLARMQRTADARRHLEVATQSEDPELRRAALASLAC